MHLNKIKKLRMTIGIKGFLCLLALVSIATATVSYTDHKYQPLLFNNSLLALQHTNGMPM